MNLIKNLFGGIGKLLAAIFGIFGSLGKLLPSGKGSKAKKASGKGSKAEKAIFLDGADAKGFASKSKAAAPSKPAPAKAAAAATSKALNLPQPTVTSTSEVTAPTYSQFGPRRRPGANMKTFLDMAKTANVPVR
jgi:murein DD-endopeptidase MepM/ murein hydrolase activator NlpD